MKIFGADPVVNKVRVDENRTRGREAAEPPVSKGESSSRSSTVVVSGLAREAGKVNARVSVTPDLRKEKVDAIKEKIDNGQYHVSGEKIAGKIIEDIINQSR